MSDTSNVLYDAPGPKAILRDKIYNIVFTLIFLALLAWVLRTAYLNDVFDDRWQVLWDPQKGKQTAGDVWNSMIVKGVGGTLAPVVFAVPITVVLSIILVVGRTSRYLWAKIPARVYTEIARGVPVLLVMFFGLFALGMTPFWSVVLGLAVYNIAVVSEILRAGLAALPSGQAEAGLSIGLSPTQTLLRIQLPQAVRMMMPSLVSQVVVLLKDTALGFIVGYVELLGTVKNNYNYFNDTAIVFVFVGAVLYILLNMAVGKLAHRLEARMRSKDKIAGGMPTPPKPEPIVIGANRR